VEEKDVRVTPSISATCIESIGCQGQKGSELRAAARFDAHLRPRQHLGQGALLPRNGDSNTMQMMGTPLLAAGPTQPGEPATSAV